jgi:Cellulase (glycosyl hydrolase family 5)
MSVTKPGYSHSSMSLRRFLVLVAVLACVLPATASASMKMLIGAAEDEGRNADPAVARAKMELAKAAGFNAIRITAIWAPGESKVDATQLAELQAAASAAVFDGIQVTVTVMPFGSKTTPLTTTARKQFASFAADLVKQVPLIHSLIVGNEPNINRYWLPQFGPNGEDVAATSYEQLLAQTYDAIKAVDKKAFVIGGSVSPHGSDDPTATRKTHSPTAFITDMGAAYRASGRTKAIMDAFAFHPYGDNSSQAPTVAHPNSTSIGIADYDKLVALLGKAFDGTAQLGSKLPIVYDEYGVESQIPTRKRRFYHGVEPLTTRPVPPSTQADYYDQALTMAACQPNVQAMFLFHVTDETDLNRWQSGVYYADDTPKPSRAVVKQTIAQIRSGAVDCTQGPLIHENDGWVLVGTSVRSSRSSQPTGKKPTKKRRPRIGPRNLVGLVGTT